MPRIFVFLLAAWGLIAASHHSAMAAETGIVLMHGKQGRPNRMIDGLTITLEQAGYLVETPEMCWSRNRIYDKPYPACLAEIDDAIAKLRARGAGDIIVAGMSLGGNAALGYAATHTGIKGVIALAPAADPDAMIHSSRMASAVAQAQAMVADGKGDETADFDDINNGRMIRVATSAADFLSFTDPAGPANITANAARIHVPLLWVAGTLDASQTYAAEIFRKVPANPLDRLVSVDSDHVNTPDASRDAVIEWLKALN